MGFFDFLFGPAVPSITAEELSQRLKVGKHPLVLDVRQSPPHLRRDDGSGAAPVRDDGRRVVTAGLATPVLRASRR